MKQHFFKLRHVFYVLAITGLTVGSSNTSYARKQKEIVQSSSASLLKNPKVTFVESTADAQVFKVTFDADEAVKFSLTITDDHNQVLFSDEFEAAQFSKKVKLVNEGYGNAPGIFYFTLRELPAGNKHVFGVENKTVVLNDVVITKL